jgi:predicted protein tyrosine phosphatase
MGRDPVVENWPHTRLDPPDDASRANPFRVLTADRIRARVAAKRVKPYKRRQTYCMKRVLFICSQNRLRSPTAEQVFSSCPALECNSAGLNHDAKVTVTPEIVEWAQVIFVMEKAHRDKLQRKFRTQLNGKRLICLNIPDEYDFMDPELVRLLRLRIPQFLPEARVCT